MRTCECECARTHARAHEPPNVRTRCVMRCFFGLPLSFTRRLFAHSLCAACACLVARFFFNTRARACAHTRIHTHAHSPYLPLTPRLYYWSMDASAAELLPCERACVDEFFSPHPPPLSSTLCVTLCLPACLLAYPPPPHPTPSPSALPM